jgi:hypothetical protein
LEPSGLSLWAHAIVASGQLLERDVFGYLVYALLVIAGFGLWIALFLGMRKGTERTRNAAGYLLIGPLHAYLRKRNYTLTKRELLGWGVVLLLMLLVPGLTWFIER